MLYFNFSKTLTVFHKWHFDFLNLRVLYHTKFHWKKVQGISHWKYQVNPIKYPRSYNHFEDGQTDGRTDGRTDADAGTWTDRRQDWIIYVNNNNNNSNNNSNIRRTSTFQKFWLFFRSNTLTLNLRVLYHTWTSSNIIYKNCSNSKVVPFFQISKNLFQCFAP